MPIHLAISDAIATITIDEPDRANAITHESAKELADAWRQCQDDDEVRAVILTATGDRHFCGGHDLSPVPDVGDDLADLLALDRTFRPRSATVNGFRTGVDPMMADHFPRLTKPVVAAVNGWAVGAGLYLLLASTDIRVADRASARFRYGLVSRGWIGAGPSATLLLRQLRHVDAMRMLLEDPIVDAEEALRIGLVNELVEAHRLSERAHEIAAELAAKPVHAVRFIKEFAHRFADLPVDQAWRVQSLMNDLLLHNTADGKEGRRAFLERREPRWSGDYANPDIDSESMTDAERERYRQLRRDVNW